MYIVTFYSFKGGVGRTLALANIGLELARTGRRVLLVDFDLEAPGVDTFERLKLGEAGPGLVDYICDYMRTKSSPDVRGYVHEAVSEGQEGGRIWIMPSGKRTQKYSDRLNSIDWQRLYDEYDGYLMFEDLKLQWQECFKPDYVLIDSRTGHTDIAGVCTRQLPDAVVILFFPNEQNLVGLKTVVSSIRCEDDSFKGNKRTQLHFVMSNVPDLDDEYEILSGLERRFREVLGYRRLTCTIHRYDSLLLLRQSLFVVERPQSRLAKEYRTLAEKITEQNTLDRSAAIRWLRKEGSTDLLGADWTKREEHVDEIVKHHPTDGELLYLVAMNCKRRGLRDKYEALLDASSRQGYESPEALLERAKLLHSEGRNPEALDRLNKILITENLEVGLLTDVLSILKRIDPEHLPEVADTPAFRSLKSDKCAWITRELNRSHCELDFAVRLLKMRLDNRNITVAEANEIKSDLVLSLIGLSRCEEVLALYGPGRPPSSDLNVQEAFNYAMAEWAQTHVPPPDMFKRVIDLDTTMKSFTGANYLQCLAIAFWALGKNDEALDRVEKARSMALNAATSFSCWRFRGVTSEEMVEDCNKIERLIKGEQLEPDFFHGTDRLDSPTGMLRQF